MSKLITPEDICIYIYEENNALPRPERLTACGALYANSRGLLGSRNFTINHEPNQKPFFAEQPQIQFSISHSGKYWLAAFHSRPVGVDIQQHKTCAFTDIAQRWYHPDEYRAVLNKGAESFFAIWCAKESYCKMLGKGINKDFSRFSVLQEICAAQLQPFKLDTGYSACVCAKNIGEIKLYHLS